jgi:hypothetical protein
VSATQGSTFVGIRAPRALEITYTATAAVPDFSGVTAASLRVFREDDTEQAWTCTIASQTATTIVLVHPWVSGDNDTDNETIRVFGQLTINGQVLEMLPVFVTFKPR